MKLLLLITAACLASCASALDFRENCADTKAISTGARLPQAGLLIDLNADQGVITDPKPVLAGPGFKAGEVAIWENQADSKRITVFENFRPHGRPTLRQSVAALGGRNAIVFAEDELINYDEDALDHLTTGSGYTWIAVIAAHAQTHTRPPYHHVNSFFGNLKNGPEFEGFWAGFNDDNTIWTGARNARSFGRWNADNPKLAGPVLAPGRFHVVAGRMGAGRGSVPIDFFVDERVPVDTAIFVVNPSADASKLAIGQERDATNHPGKESFHGEIARFLVWERPLSDVELSTAIAALKQYYGL